MAVVVAAAVAAVAADVGGGGGGGAAACATAMPSPDAQFVAAAGGRGGGGGGGGFGGGGGGGLVAPGVYKVTMTAGGKSYTTTITVRRDPSLKDGDNGGGGPFALDALDPDDPNFRAMEKDRRKTGGGGE